MRNKGSTDLNDLPHNSHGAGESCLARPAVNPFPDRLQVANCRSSMDWFLMPAVVVFI